MTHIQDVRTYLMGFANTYVGQSVSSCMANQGTQLQVAEYNLVHVHMYSMCSTILYIHIHICRLYVLVHFDVYML